MTTKRKRRLKGALGRTLVVLTCPCRLAASMQDSEEAKHRSWYIDFRDCDNLMSAIEFTKNIMFEKHEDSDPEVYWEIRHFAKAFHKNHKQVNMTNWWRNQKTRYFDHLQKEFDLSLREVRPSWKSACQQNTSINYTSCTTENIVGTKGLLVMLLHWGTSYQKHSGRATSQAVLHDLLKKMLSRMEDEDELLRLCKICEATYNTNEEDTYITHEHDTQEDDWHPMSYKEKMDEDKTLPIARSLMRLFASRKKWEQWRQQLVTGLHVLASHIDKIILNGLIGQESLDSPRSQPAQGARKNGMSLKNKKVKGRPKKGKASRSENADRRSKQRKGTNRSLPEAKGTVLESRNEKRSKSSSTLKQSLQEEKDQVQQPSKNDVPEELNDLNLTMQSHMERKAEETEIQDDDLTGNSSEKECSAPMHDRLKDTASAEKHKLLDDSEKPTLKDVTSTAEGKRKRKQKRCRKVSGEKKI